jgi:hypothetical protein
MKISMKYWKIGAYFGSIALAVTIGMFATTANQQGATSTCIQGLQSNMCPNQFCGSYNTCQSVEAGKGADECNTSTSTACYEAGTTCNTPGAKRDSAGLVYRECSTDG